ncbi:MAG: transcription antitermination protein NusB [Micavibrio sp.]
MTDASKQQKPQGSKIARSSAARLAAVQAVYQILSNQQSADSVIAEYRLHRLGQPVEGAAMVTPDGDLFQTIVSGVYERMNALEDMIAAALQKNGKSKPSEPLLMAVLLCGAYELLDNRAVDAPIILSDYLNVTHAFYEQGESRLVNAVLDAIKAVIR